MQTSKEQRGMPAFHFSFQKVLHDFNIF